MREMPRGRAGCPYAGAEGQPTKTTDRRRRQRSARRKALPRWLSRPPDCQRAEGRGLKGQGGEPTCRAAVPPPAGAAAALLVDASDGQE